MVSMRVANETPTPVPTFVPGLERIIVRAIVQEVSLSSAKATGICLLGYMDVEAWDVTLRVVVADALMPGATVLDDCNVASLDVMVLRLLLLEVRQLMPICWAKPCATLVSGGLNPTDGICERGPTVNENGPVVEGSPATEEQVPRLITVEMTEYSDMTKYTTGQMLPNRQHSIRDRGHEKIH